MNIDIDFETYLFISPDKIIISVNDKINFETIYEKENLIDIEKDGFNYVKIDEFLNENVFLIEKTLKKFVKKINLIIKSEVFFSVSISIKNKNNTELISQKKIDYLLNEAKSLCQETLQEKKIIHMIIENYLINNKNHKYLNLDKKYDFLSLDICFLCLSEDIIKNFVQILSKYQISIDQIINAEYVEKFSENEKIDIFTMANKIINGFNENEVKIVSQKYKKKGFFERFFDLFS